MTSTHADASQAAGAPSPRHAAAFDVILALSIARQGVGVEIARPVRLGCARVTALATTLPTIRFPLDVSGGVARFRHRRGQLDRVEVMLDARAVERWAAPKMRGILGCGVPEVWIGARADGATICVSAPSDDADDSPEPAVAFELLVLAEGEDLVLIVHDARGVDLAAPPLVVALASAEAALGRVAERTGALFTVRRVAASIAAAILPEAGARLPSTEAVRCNVVAAERDGWFIQAVRDAASAPASEAALRAREVAVASREADELLVTGRTADARAAYLRILENSPRHPGLLRRVLDLDAHADGRGAAALSWADELSPSGIADTGIVRGRLMSELGDRDGAIAALERAAEAERAPAMAARAHTLAAACTIDAAEVVQRLDRALARSPRYISARRARVEARLALGQVDDALADVEHLEALARGARAKYAVWARAGRAWHEHALHARAERIFERALRFAPDDPTALAGLATALLAGPAIARGAALLRRALDLAIARNEPWHGIAVQFAEVLAERLDDLPAAIAHAAAVPLDGAEAPIARGLEGRWRAQLGDAVGASLAYGRLREIAQSWREAPGAPATTAQSPGAPRAGRGEGRVSKVVQLLREAADFELRVRDDPSLAQRTIATAMRLRPHDLALKAAFRALGARILERLRDPNGPPQASQEWREVEAAAAAASAAVGASPDEPARPPRGAGDPPLADPLERAEDKDALDAERAARVEELVRRHHAAPSDDRVADELASLLEALDRGHELLALLLARLEDAAEDRRAVLLPRVRSTLERMAASATSAGREDEGSLYRSALEALS